MTEGVIGFSVEAGGLVLQPLPLLLAFLLALLIRGWPHGALCVLNLWLLSELAASLLEPGYRFGVLMAERLLASALQIAIAFALLTLWRYWRTATSSVTAH